MSTLQLSCPSFAANAAIPDRFTWRGSNVSPPLSIQGAPPNTASLALILYDPDAPIGDFVHWLVWNIKPSTITIPENSLPEGVQQGKTDFGDCHYGGPSSPSGTHRYIFELFALDVRLELPECATSAQLIEAMQDHILNKATFMGIYGNAN